jgi:hypothetical protein
MKQFLFFLIPITIFLTTRCTDKKIAVAETTNQPGAADYVRPSFESGIIYQTPEDVNIDSMITRRIITSGRVVEVRDSFGFRYLNLDELYPSNKISIVAEKKTYLNNFDDLSTLKGKTIMAYGDAEFIKDHLTGKNRPGIKINQRTQIVLINPF